MRHLAYLLVVILCTTVNASFDEAEQRAFTLQTVSTWNDKDNVAEPLLTELNQRSWQDGNDAVAKTCHLCGQGTSGVAKISVALEFLRHDANQRKEIKVLVEALRNHLIQSRVDFEMSYLVDRVARIPCYQRAYLFKDLFRIQDWSQITWYKALEDLRQQVTCLHNISLIIRYKLWAAYDIQQAVAAINKNPL